GAANQGVRHVESFGRLLRRHRESSGLTQEALASRSGLSVDAVSLLERGLRQRPRPSTVLLLSEALGLSAEDSDALLSASRQPAVDGPAAALELWPPATSFLGREDQVEEVCQLLHGDGARLITLTGPAGVGKTRLAVAVAAAAAPAFPDGMVAVSLAS